MSRSKRQAVFVDGYGSPGKKIDKRLASKAVRNFEGEIPDGNFYRKISDSWSITDYRFDLRWDAPSTPWWHDYYHLKIINGRYYQNK